MQIRRPQHAPRGRSAFGSGGVHVVDQLLLVPHVIAGGQHIGAQVEDLLGDLRRHAEAAGGVLNVHDRQLDLVRLAHVADVLAHDPASRAAEDVADEKNVQVQLLALASASVS